MKRLLPTLLLLSLAAPASALPGPGAASYAWGAQLTVDGYDAAKPALTNFPVLVRIAENTPSGFSYAQVLSPDGADLCFIDLEGNGLPFEIDTWNTNGTSLVWVTLPTMEQGTQFVMCWGGATSGKTVCPDNPWGAYLNVWHMNETNVVDSAAAGYDGTASGTVALDAAAPVGSGMIFPGDTSSYVSFGSKPNSDLASGTTIECWIKNASGAGCIFQKKEFVQYRYNGAKLRFTTRGVTDVDMSEPPANGTWYHAVVTFAPNGGRSALVLYIDGAQVWSGTTSDYKASEKTKSADMKLGITEWAADPFNGSLDEFRLSSSPLSADWIAADYAAQSDSAFLTAGAATPYEATPTPQVGIVVSDVQYTNATLAVSVGSLGQDDTMTEDASWVDATLLVAADDSFADPLFVLPLARTNEAPVAFPVAVQPLATNATYYARVLATNSFGVAGESGVSSFTTRAPGAATGLATFLATGFTNLTVSGRVADFGVGSASASIRLEASETADFAAVVATTNVPAALGADADFTVEGLQPGTAYHLRLRVVNEWGVETFLPVADTHATLDIPLVATGLGYTFSPDNATVSFTFGVSETFGAGPFSAELTYNGRTVGTQSFSGPGLLSWAGVAAASSAQTATVNVTAVANGTTYTRSWSVNVAPGARVYTVSSLADLATLALFVGDSVTLPALQRTDDCYLPLDVRSFALGEDGRTLVAIAPGFSAVAAMEWDAAADAYVRNPAMGFAICIPEAAGRVFVAEAGGANMNWSDASKWRCVTDSSVANAYPDGAGDVAMIPLAKDRSITLDADATVGAVYAGWDASAPAAGTVYFRATNRTLTFDTGAVDADKIKMPGLFRVTGLSRTDVNTDRPTFTFGGNGSANRLFVSMPDGLGIDGGKCPDYADTTLRDKHNRLRFVNGSVAIEVPAGATLRFDNFDHSGGWGDSQMWNCAALRCGTGFQISGTGTVVYDSASCGYFEGAFKDFAGTFFIRQKERYASVGVDSRGGGFWLRANTGYEAKNATFVIEGESGYSSAARNSLGLATYGSTHGSGCWGAGDNSFGGRAMVMAGGVLVHRGNVSGNWATAGIFNLPNRSDALVVSNGYSVIDAYNHQAVSASGPTNRMEFASLRHANRGTLRVTTTDTANYTQAARTSSSHCIVRNAEGFAIGGGGADGSYTESVIPWIVSEQQYDNRIYFPYLGTRDGETDCLVLYKHPTAKALAAATNPFENVYVGGASVALSQDATVNALYVNDNWSKGTALGEGRTLTVTSGGVILEGSRAAIGKEAEFLAGTAGTIALPGEGYVYSTIQSSSSPNEIWASIVAPKGLAISFPGYLRLGGDQTGIDEELAINGCDVTLGSETTGCTIDVPVRLESGAAKLRIAKAGSFCKQDLRLNDHAGAGPKFAPAAGTEEVVHKMWINGANRRRGYYGSNEAADSMAALASFAHPMFVDDEHFSGTGWIKVMTDELTRSTLMILR